MRENEVIEYYSGDFITSLGRPHLVLVGYEEDEKLICEKYILFEELDGRQSHIGEVVKCPKRINLYDDLTQLMESQGLEHAKSTIYLEAYKEGAKKLSPEYHFGIKEINLRKSTKESFLMYFKTRAVTQLNWIYNYTTSEKLKQLINLYKSFEITHDKID